jgi:hypothetical protein
MRIQENCESLRSVCLRSNVTFTSDSQRQKQHSQIISTDEGGMPPPIPSLPFPSSIHRSASIYPLCARLDIPHPPAPLDQCYPKPHSPRCAAASSDPVIVEAKVFPIPQWGEKRFPMASESFLSLVPSGAPVRGAMAVAV